MSLHLGAFTSNCLREHIIWFKKNLHEAAVSSCSAKMWRIMNSVSGFQSWRYFAKIVFRTNTAWVRHVARNFDRGGKQEPTPNI